MIIPTEKRWLAKRRLACIEKLGGECILCRFKPTLLPEFNALQFHHPDGNKDKEHTQTVMKNIIAGANEYELLCANCHITANIRDKTRGYWTKYLDP